MIKPFVFAALLLSCHSLLAKTVKVMDVIDLVAACQKAEPNDEIILSSGIYTLSDRTRILISNRPGPILVRGESGKRDEVVVEGLGQDNRAVEMVFELTDSPGWTFQDLTTRKTYYHGFKFNAGSSGCVLRNVVMRDHGESGVKGTSDPERGVHPDKLLIERCDIGFTAPAGGTREVVEGVDGVAVKGWIIRNSRFINIQRNGQPAYAVFTKGNSLETIIEENRFENCFIGASFGGGGTGTAYFRDHDQSCEHRWGSIRSNTFISCTDAAIYINKGNACEIDSNRIIDCGANIQLRYPQSTGWIRNNLVNSKNDEPIVRARDGATIIEDKGNRLDEQMTE